MIPKLCSKQSHKIDLLYLIVATGIITTQPNKVVPINQWANQQSVYLFSVVCDKRIKKFSAGCYALFFTKVSEVSSGREPKSFFWPNFQLLSKVYDNEITSLIDIYFLRIRFIPSEPF